MADLFLYAKPTGATVTLTLDTGQVVPGAPVVANGRDDAYRLTLPPNTLTQGGVAVAAADGCVAQRVRGILLTDGDPASFEFDDFGELAVATAPPEPGPEPTPTPDPTADPLAIITAVYEQGEFDLSTKEGNGEYTEAACTALHEQHSPHWGHIRKTGAQNQWNGHAVDAIMTLYPIGATVPGGYDIILNSVSPDASPTFHYAGGPDPTLWYYPAAPAADAALNTQLVDAADDIRVVLHKTQGAKRYVAALLDVVDRLVRRRAGV